MLWFLPPTWPHTDSSGSAAICTVAVGGAQGTCMADAALRSPGRVAGLGMDVQVGTLPWYRVRGYQCAMRGGQVLGQHLCVHIQVVCFCSYSFSTNCRFSFKLHNAR